MRLLTKLNPFNTKKDFKVIFLHIPKTAGSSFGKIIKANYENSEIFLATAGKVGTREYIPSSLNDFRSLASERQKKIKVLKGHFPYGIHEEMRWKKYHYICFIRKPIERLFSEFHFIKDNPIHPLHKTCNEISFRDYALSKSYCFDNQQIRMIAGAEYLYENNIEKVFKKAMKNIQSKNFTIGFTEYFDFSIRKIKTELNWNHVKSQKVRYPSSKPGMDTIPKKTIQEIESFNKWDVMFYDSCIKIFKNEIFKV